MTPDAGTPAVSGWPVTVAFPIHWSEMDAFGHVNNARYLTWFETARVEYFRKIGLMMSGPSALGPIIAAATCEYLEPIVYPAELVVGVRALRIGNTSFTLEYAVRRGGESKLSATGTTVVVTLDYRIMQKVRVPEELRREMLKLQPDLGRVGAV